MSWCTTRKTGPAPCDNGCPPPMKRTLIFFCSLILSLLAHAKPLQSEDYVDFGEEGHYVRADPLNKYLTYFCAAERLEAYVNDFCVPYWPDYTRYWEIRYGRLYLVRIAANDEDVEYPLELLFPRYDGTPILAEWFSGILSYQLGDSPVIELNREFFEEESVVRLIKGKVVERFTTNHKERWISYAKRIMDNQYPLAGIALEFPGDSPPAKGWMAEFLADVYRPITHPHEKPSIYYPLIDIEFNADLEDFKPTRDHQALTGYELLETIARETGTVLDVAVSNRLVVCSINEGEATGSNPSESSLAAQTPDKIPSE